MHSMLYNAACCWQSLGLRHNSPAMFNFITPFASMNILHCCPLMLTAESRIAAYSLLVKQTEATSCSSIMMELDQADQPFSNLPHASNNKHRASDATCTVLTQSCLAVAAWLQVCLCVPMKQVTVTVGHPLMADA
jgi:hypothetical protein